VFDLDDVTALEEMTTDECFRVIATQHLGRVGLVVAGRPLVLPVNYALIGKTVVFRTARGSSFDRVVRGADVVFEIDHADPAYHSGWSVMGRGRADGIDENVDLESLTHHLMRPWARESPPGWIGIPLSHVTGRRIVHFHRRR
jgi:nitroimidazol reductase NimA-like FMN-containing flavoprotein (pyridoxamine 5'-phosphate oxidase superfamily)